MVDQVYYKVQYPLKKAIDLMKAVDNEDLSSLSKNLDNYDKERIMNFIENWDEGGKEKITSLIKELRSKKQ